MIYLFICSIEDFATQNCKHGNWGNWGEWSNCSSICGQVCQYMSAYVVSICGQGRIQRYRKCDSPAPEHGGKDCPGDNWTPEGIKKWTQIIACNGIWQYFPHTGKCYKKFPAKDLIEAREYCNSEALPDGITKGSLVSIPDQKTENFLADISNMFWTCGRKDRTINSWFWLDETRWAYKNWHTGEPVDDMYWLSYQNGGWRARSREEEKKFICQYDYINQ